MPPSIFLQHTLSASSVPSVILPFPSEFYVCSCQQPVLSSINLLSVLSYHVLQATSYNPCDFYTHSSIARGFYLHFSTWFSVPACSGDLMGCSLVITCSKTNLPRRALVKTRKLFRHCTLAFLQALTFAILGMLGSLTSANGYFACPRILVYSNRIQ